ncbi:hypothetical protein [Synoicihabitans lomoniglobus]|uniref:UPF0158 family protein n=1 Tax=Synoicihabitans lomoniglobus TaxID=2909285 RepID=A0AAE9ZXU9_9BACT|nr:UPF0158 family protein [Opitutaceae bacterium LMO-M01]WED65144.1 UPF0158 family protein [Opitutaceae bacterium LMO-M01]
MTVAVRMYDLMSGFEMPEEWHAYVDRETGKVLTFDEEVLREADNAAEEDLDDESWAMGSPWEDDVIAAVRAIVADPATARYVELPSKFDFHEYRRMEEFVDDMPGGEAQHQLWRALKGKGAFRRFKDTAHRLEVIDAWYAFREAARERLLQSWAHDHDLALAADEPPPPNPGA